jgi:hypothetical protein
VIDPNAWRQVKATREGLVGKKTASTYVIDTVVYFVALPSVHALHKFVELRYLGRSVWAQVLDVGPWNVDDDTYVFNGARPQAETGIDKFGRPTNGAGIDLGEAVRRALEITDDNVEIEWRWAS